MCFDVTDVDGVHIGDFLRHRDHLRLAFDARRGVTDLVGTVVVNRTSQNQGVDVIAIGDRFIQTLKHHHTHAIRSDGAGGCGIESAAVTVWRDHAAFVMKVAAFMRNRHMDAAGKGHVAFVGQ